MSLLKTLFLAAVGLPMSMVFILGYALYGSWTSVIVMLGLASMTCTITYSWFFRSWQMRLLTYALNTICFIGMMIYMLPTTATTISPELAMSQGVGAWWSIKIGGGMFVMNLLWEIETRRFVGEHPHNAMAYYRNEGKMPFLPSL